MWKKLFDKDQLKKKKGKRKKEKPPKSINNYSKVAYLTKNWTAKVDLKPKCVFSCIVVGIFVYINVLYMAIYVHTFFF